MTYLIILGNNYLKHFFLKEKKIKKRYKSKIAENHPICFLKSPNGKKQKSSIFLFGNII